MSTVHGPKRGCKKKMSMGTKLREDTREQLFNKRETGPAKAIQLPTEAITSLHGILLDVDCKLFRSDGPIPGLERSPRSLFRKGVAEWISRDPALASAEVRATGGGVHVIIWLDPSIEFQTDQDRDRWIAMVKVLQASLPTDPDAPA